MAPRFTFQRGEEIRIDLVVESDGGYAPDTLDVSMGLKRASAGQVPPRAAPVVKTFAISFFASSGDQPAYWRGTISASETTNMSGLYVTDAVIADGSEILEVTTPAFISVEESVTPA